MAANSKPVIEKVGEAIEWEAHAWHSEPVKSVATLIGWLPFGRVAPCQQGYPGAQSQELLYCYPPVHPYYGEMLYSPLLLVEARPEELIYMHSLDDVVRPKRFYLRAESGYFHVELIAEERAYAWKPIYHMPRWRIARCEASCPGLRCSPGPHRESIPSVPWAERKDVPDLGA